MPVTQLQHTQMSIEESLRGRQPDTSPEKMAGKGRKRIIAGIITVCLQMLLILGEVIHPCLCIIPVKRRDREEGRDLDGHFQARRMRSQAPVIDIEPVIRTEDNPVSQEIVQPQPQRQLEPAGRQFLDRIGPIRKKYAVKRQPQVPVLFNKVQEYGSLQPAVDDL